MTAIFYQVLHVSSVLLLTAVTFKAFANPDVRRKGMTMMLSGILAVTALVGGFGLMAKLQYGWDQGWIFVKIGSWLVLSAAAGIAYRRPGLTGILGLVTAVALVAAVWAVYTRPF